MKICINLQRRLQACLEIVAADLDKAELHEMRIVELRVQQHIAPVNQPGDQMHQRDL